MCVVMTGREGRGPLRHLTLPKVGSKGYSPLSSPGPSKEGDEDSKGPVESVLPVISRFRRLCRLEVVPESRGP